MPRGHVDLGLWKDEAGLAVREGLQTSRRLLKKHK